jgi:hypothetical protein
LELHVFFLDKKHVQPTPYDHTTLHLNYINKFVIKAFQGIICYDRFSMIDYNKTVGGCGKKEKNYSTSK